ncbi:tRNA preQ1(34) S-adenosylmethionine ribosyltransferase-isomerase QueA [Candidatus Kinetoplastidibacterium crithidiae]|uniref:S-adenosylmethionine:tRNA ribosyltransferase-isomerase n=1 Tax=Candidatus Kinetoplastidibacterium crithidiae TCC036E TaxID=1208918 RepID=M1L3U9_9PROT|nr:tRNA preQ1(34) S-adenosylmethionine ribosyltransferase-isomerase QueA [Candidatus Kinetoplastibacterium crithidii]AFZ83142.1 S-adenosylmethionine:tRNA ribosyltransferase-isomerase [Candidatus Kinetoplastibacterium crithidii (ex Angomonas deanei ATCC 30255)]AGF47418.1 S-adenosylmethionine:tRNA ribosyltransferase-isomerase [Candidatus Kinetoplastibacterium crithidii TCC036E]
MQPLSLEKKFFEYILPEDLIAQSPSKERSSSRLLYVDHNKKMHDLYFYNIVNLMKKGDLLIFNNTKVIKARLSGHKESGGKIEIMIERILNNNRALAQIKSNKPIRDNTKIFISDRTYAIIEKRHNDFFELKFSDCINKILDQYGRIPLPPYIKKNIDEIDELRYQTVYAKLSGAVAAPTAGLHFDNNIISDLEKFGIETSFITLHVGAGTFQPIRTSSIEKHIMHSEQYHVPQNTIEKIKTARSSGNKIIAVGTTTARALESASLINNNYDCINRTILEETNGETQLYIRPGYKFRIIDNLITNFHLPKSTLLLLVAALTGQDTIHEAYQHAIKEKYRFFSYGDAMFIEPSI